MPYIRYATATLLAVCVLLVAHSARGQSGETQGEAQQGQAPGTPQQSTPRGEPQVQMIGARQLEGTVMQVEDVPIEGTQLVHKAALLQTENGTILADLGPAADLQDIGVKQGTSLSMRGVLVEVEGRPFFVAETLQVGTQSIDVRRSPMPAPQ